uniref:Collagen alpha-1(I) chain-like n=1 Tax=Phascolarctos cinereus TaxID=38626 RepID=A0A6P5M182_PHACI|nr:collagen alpha-1(I) chain-like [Phascolarctos cinereus]
MRGVGGRGGTARGPGPRLGAPGGARAQTQSDGRGSCAARGHRKCPPRIPAPPLSSPWEGRGSGERGTGRGTERGRLRRWPPGLSPVPPTPLLPLGSPAPRIRVGQGGGHFRSRRRPRPLPLPRGSLSLCEAQASRGRPAARTPRPVGREGRKEVSSPPAAGSGLLEDAEPGEGGERPAGSSSGSLEGPETAYMQLHAPTAPGQGEAGHEGRGAWPTVHLGSGGEVQGSIPKTKN